MKEFGARLRGMNATPHRVARKPDYTLIRLWRDRDEWTGLPDGFWHNSRLCRSVQIVGLRRAIHVRKASLPRKNLAYYRASRQPRGLDARYSAFRFDADAIVDGTTQASPIAVSGMRSNCGLTLSRGERLGERGDFHPLASPWGREPCGTDRMTSLNWGHHSPGSDDAFPTPSLMESIVVIALFPFLTAAFVLFFVTTLESAADLAFVFGLAFACPEPNDTLASPLTITSIFPSASINRGAMPPIKLITMPSTTVAFAKLGKLSLYRGFSRSRSARATVEHRSGGLTGHSWHPLSND